MTIVRDEAMCKPPCPRLLVLEERMKMEQERWEETKEAIKTIDGKLDQLMEAHHRALGRKGSEKSIANWTFTIIANVAAFGLLIVEWFRK